MPYLIHFLFIALISINSFASVKDNILTDCKQALDDVPKLSPLERQETIQFIERILSVDPEVSPSVSIRLMPSAQQFAISDDLRKSLIPSRDPEVIECALRLLPGLLPESISLLPVIIKQAVEARTSNEVKEKYERASIRLIQDAVEKKVPISPTIIKEVTVLLKGESSSLAQVVILEIGSEAISEMLSVSTSADDDLFRMIIETVRIIRPSCIDLQPILSKMITSVDDKLRLRGIDYLSQCSEMEIKVREAVITLLADKSIEVRKAAASLVSKFLNLTTQSELYQIISLVSDKEWRDVFIPIIQKSEELKSSFHRASFNRFEEVSPEIALRILDVSTKDDVKLLQKVITNKKYPAFLRIAIAHTLLRMNSGVDEANNILSEKPTVVNSEEEKQRLIIHLLSVQYSPQYREYFIPLIRAQKERDNELFESAARKVLPKLSTKDFELIFRSGNSQIILELLGKIKLSDSKVISALLRESFNDPTPKNRALWAKALSYYGKEIKNELAKKLKGAFDPKAYLIGAATRLISKQQANTALSRDDYTCEERKIFHDELEPNQENRGNFLKSILICVSDDEEEFSKGIIAKLKPLSESEEESLISSLLANSRQISIISLPYEFSNPREERFIASLFEGATPIETRDLFRALSLRPYVSTPLIDQAKKIYESSSDEALRYEALKLIVKFPHDGFDSKSAVREALRNPSNFERGVSLLQSMRPEEASVVLAQSLRELPIDRLRKLIELIPSLGIHDPALMGAVDEVSERVIDPETQYRIAAMKVVLNPNSPDSESKIVKYFYSRFSREFREKLLPHRKALEELLIGMKRKSTSSMIKGIIEDLLRIPNTAT